MSAKLRGLRQRELDDAQESVRMGVEQLIPASITKSTSTDIHAHYRFRAVLAGRYAVVATWKYSDEEIVWRVPVAHGARGAISVVDLTQNNDDSRRPSSRIASCQ